MTTADLHLVAPGPLDQWTGGYIYDARIAGGLRDLGWRVAVHALDGAFPEADAVARQSMTAVLAAIATGDRVVVDGLAMGGLPGPIEAERARLRLLSLVHHPLADEAGLGADRRRRFAALERQALAACRGVLVTSEFTARRLEDYGIGADRIRAVRPGVDPAPQAAGPAPGLPPALLCVGSVTPRKGQAELVQALAGLGDLRWTCVCVGRLDPAPDYAASVRRLIGHRGLGDRIRLVGECAPAQLDALYHQASLFVLPSRYEGYGMALAEALARGLGIVSTTGGAIPHTVPAGAAVLVPPGDAPALAAALRPLLTGSRGAERRTALAAAARIHARALPDWDQAALHFATAARELTRDGNV